MTTFNDLRDYFMDQSLNVIIAADAETVTHRKVDGEVSRAMSAGGVSTAFDPIAKASGATYIGRAKTQEDKDAAGKRGVVEMTSPEGNYRLKRLFLERKEFEDYYFGYANQTLWPLCHVAFETPMFDDSWYEGFKKVNQRFARSIQEELNQKSFVWINDYQLSLVPSYLNRPKNTTVAFFWHIPWPTWEIFRILPQKKEILESLLSTDFLAFHRGYHVRNFLNTVRRELEARIDEETRQVYYKGHVTTVASLPMGIDTDVVKSMVSPEDGFLSKAVRNVLKLEKKRERYDQLFKNYKVVLGVDRLDYTKGLSLRLLALEKFFENNRNYRGKVVYIGVLAPSREEISSYKETKEQVKRISDKINRKYQTESWKPLYHVYDMLKREEVISLYKRADVCLVTPRDDGMNLVSKEFVAASSMTKDPGMLVLSEFAGSATDLTSALIINPYDFKTVSEAIKKGLEMKKDEKLRRTKSMARTLDENNVYLWAMNFVKSAQSSKE